MPRVPKEDITKAKAKALAHLADGLTVRDAMSKVDRTVATYDQWRVRDPDFKVATERLRARQSGKANRPELGDFGEWREKYIGMKTYPHMWQWVDVLEGREPRLLTDDQTYVKGRAQRIIINTPPFHAKSTTITMDWVTYQVCKNPNVRIIIISENRDMALKFLTGIKDRLTNPRYDQMHYDFGPVGGFKVGSASWKQNLIYVGNRDSVEKDPTVEVLGIGSQIYGARADFILMDDCVTLKTARTKGQREKLVEFIDQDVSSRLGPQGKLLLIGTRVSPNDVYMTMLTRREGVWTYLGQPAVKEFADDPAEWITLWPETIDPESGELTQMWDGHALAIRRDEIEARTWNLVYQQQQISEDSVFPEEAVQGCLYLGNVGPLQEGGIRPMGMSGMYVVAGLDPATPAGFSAIVVLAVDKLTKVRYVLDVINERMTPYVMRERIKSTTQRYRPAEWRIEKNGLNQMVSQDHEIRNNLFEMGSRVVEHNTQTNKWDADFGVASLATMFLGALEVPKRALIAIPNNNTHKGVRALVDQLVTWSPETAGKTDVLMALWFADLGCRKVLDAGNIQPFQRNRWLTDGQRDSRRVVNLEEYANRRGAM